MKAIDIQDPRVLLLLQAIGAPYAWGSGDLGNARQLWPDGPFDCSGFAQACLVALGMVRPRAWNDLSARGLADACDSVELEEARIGDLAFYGSGVTHVTVCIGAGMTIGANGGGSKTNADDPRARVQIRPIVYRNDLVTVGRLKAKFTLE